MLSSLFRSRSQPMPSSFRAAPVPADANKRRDRRWTVALDAMMVIDGALTPVHVLDLSLQGALAHSGVGAPSNSLVFVHWRGFETLARVVWARGGRFGLKFQTPLTPAQLNGIVTAHA
jgi:hypothetical protein